jgi:large subunit ribosomal protein L24
MPGEDKGKTGKVLKVLVKEGRAIVEGINYGIQKC